jgi:DNA-binding protein Fis
VPFKCQVPPEGIYFEEVIEQLEKGLISQAVQMTGGNVAKTARLLSLPRGTLRYKMEKYGLAESE